MVAGTFYCSLFVSIVGEQDGSKNCKLISMKFGNCLTMDEKRFDYWKGYGYGWRLGLCLVHRLFAE